jgi:hypothetical protein
MIKMTNKLLCLALAMGLTANTAHAGPSDADKMAAMALLAIAALSHNEHHYQEGWSPSGAQETADFERGYRDGVHNVDYNARGSDRAYGEGFSAGMKERENSLAGSTRAESEGPAVPPIAMQGCAKIVAQNFGVGAHHVHITRTLERGPSDFLVEAAVGHKYMTCVMGDGGTVVDVTGGRMQ